MCVYVRVCVCVHIYIGLYIIHYTTTNFSLFGNKISRDGQGVPGLPLHDFIYNVYTLQRHFSNSAVCSLKISGNKNITVLVFSPIKRAYLFGQWVRALVSLCES